MEIIFRNNPSGEPPNACIKNAEPLGVGFSIVCDAEIVFPIYMMCV